MDNSDCYKWQWQKGNNRYYQAYLYKDMFGDWIVTRVWGGLYSRLGNYKNCFVPSYAAGIEEIKKIAKQRERRGYIKWLRPEINKGI